MPTGRPHLWCMWLLVQWSAGQTGGRCPAWSEYFVIKNCNQEIQSFGIRAHSQSVALSHRMIRVRDCKILCQWVLQVCFCISQEQSMVYCSSHITLLHYKRNTENISLWNQHVAWCVATRIWCEEIKSRGLPPAGV